MGLQPQHRAALQQCLSSHRWHLFDTVVTDTPYDPPRLQETITLHNGAMLTRVRGSDWSVEGDLPDLFPFHDDERLDEAIANCKQELATGSIYDYKLGKYVQIDPIHTSAMIALMEATLDMRKEQNNGREREAEAEWEQRCGVWG